MACPGQSKGRNKRKGRKGVLELQRVQAPGLKLQEQGRKGEEGSHSPK